jgi:hypothetical protein
MLDGEPFPLVLLGAGASAPAGVPTALEMTAELMRLCKRDGQQDYLRALRAISGGLQMGFGQREVAALGWSRCGAGVECSIATRGSFQLRICAVCVDLAPDHRGD